MRIRNHRLETWQELIALSAEMISSTESLTGAIDFTQYFVSDFR
jgi:hypothetical protein